MQILNEKTAQFSGGNDGEDVFEDAEAESREYGNDGGHR